MLHRLDILEIELRDSVLAHAREETRERFLLEVFVAWFRLPVVQLQRQRDAGRDILSCVSGRLSIDLDSR